MTSISVKRCTSGIAIFLIVTGAGTVSAAEQSATYSDGMVAGSKDDYATAFKIWKNLAEAGDALSQNGLGQLYSKGQGVTKDQVEAIKWFRLAASQGEAGAQVNLGIAYSKGEGITPSPEKGLMWSTIASANFSNYTLIALQNRDQMRRTLSPVQVSQGNRLTIQCLVSKLKDCDELKPEAAPSPPSSPPVSLTPHQVLAFEYPLESILAKESGTVGIEYRISADGVVDDCSVKQPSGITRLDAAACGVAGRWLFKPAMMDGQAVAIRVPAQITFTIK